MSSLAGLRHSTRASRCLACAKCTTMCPLERTGTYKARLVITDTFDTGNLQDNELARCLTCAACEERCPQEIRFAEYVRGLRELLPHDRRYPCPHGSVHQCTSRMMAGDGEVRRSLDWLDPGLRVVERGDVALFVGCAPLFDRVHGEYMDSPASDAANAAVFVLNQFGIRPVVSTGERCCGHDLLWGGEQKTFTELARLNTAHFAELGVKQVVTACAECARTWRLDYTGVETGYRPKVRHVAEFLSDWIEEYGAEFLEGSDARRARPESGGDESDHRLTFQDPCRLSRHMDAHEAPRSFLESLPNLDLVEMPRSGRDAQCCGTSGFIHCDAASRSLQKERLAMADATGSETLLTACPKCRIHFQCAQADARRRDSLDRQIRVEDFTYFAASAMGYRKEPEATRI